MELSLKAFTINKNNWYYENKKGIEVIHQMKDDNGKLICTEIFIIPWKKVGNSFRRYEATKKDRS